MGPLTSVFGMGTGIAAPLWPLAKVLKFIGTMEKYNATLGFVRILTSEVTYYEVGFDIGNNKLNRPSG